MRKIELRKRGGGVRTVYAPRRHEKVGYRRLALRLWDNFRTIPTNHLVHGFVPGRSPVTNARCHLGFKYTLTMDLADFFDTVTEGMLLRAGVKPAPARLACYFGAARQGLPSSPMAANIAASPLDRAIAEQLAEVAAEGRGPVVFTRYADDLTLSSDDLSLLLRIRDWLPGVAQKCGFWVNPKKTRIQSASFGRRIICGVSVGECDIAAPRRFRRKLRAALHRHPRSNKTRGMQEWGKLKLPTGLGLGKVAVLQLADRCRRIFGPVHTWIKL